MNLFLLGATLCCFSTIQPILAGEDAVSVAKARFPCGVRMKFGVQLIYGGWTAELGQWPWHAALYRGADYRCGGTLINQRHVLTVADCIIVGGKRKAMMPELFSIHLGKNVLDENPEEQVQIVNVSEIHVHPEFLRNRYAIALLVLSQPAQYSEFVIPICIEGRQAAKGEDLNGQKGWVAGFGETEVGKLSMQLRTASMLIVNNTECVQSDPEFFGRFISPGVLCASHRNGSSTCRGDGGGGLYIRNNNQWVLHGIASFGAMSRDNSNCDVTQYVVFTKVAFYYEWILNITSTLPTPQRTSEIKCQKFSNFAAKRSNSVCYNIRSPHTVAISDLDQRQIMSGTIISEKFVLARAPGNHDGIAFNIRKNKLLVRIGMQPGLKVARVIRHPDHDPETNHHSIMLLELQSSLFFKKHFLPACLANAVTENLNGTLLFHGYTGSTPAETFFLESIENKVVPRHQCIDAVQLINQNYTIYEREFCTLDHYEDPVFLDGMIGGPLQTHSMDNCMFTQVGVTKFSIPRTAEGQSSFNYTNVFLRVADYLDWIESVVWDENDIDDECVERPDQVNNTTEIQPKAFCRAYRVFTSF